MNEYTLILAPISSPPDGLSTIYKATNHLWAWRTVNIFSEHLGVGRNGHSRYQLKFDVSFSLIRDKIGPAYRLSLGVVTCGWSIAEGEIRAHKAPSYIPIVCGALSPKRGFLITNVDTYIVGGSHTKYMFNYIAN
jgi:hypothetical protein